MWTEAENNFDQFLDKFIMHELQKDENDNSNNNVSIGANILFIILYISVSRGLFWGC